MAEFSSFVITNKGQALMAKLIAHQGTCNFTKIRTSSRAYTDAQLPSLTSLADVKQTCDISSITRVNTTSVRIQGAVNNSSLSTGYTVNTIGLYANDPDEGEILYSVARATTPGYMPPFNGITSSGIIFDFVVTVGNAEQVTVTISPAAVATQADITVINAKISDIKGFIGYTEDDIYGVEVDFTNKVFTRLGAAVGKTPGADFDGVNAFGGRKRCIVTDGGVVLAYYGETGYVEGGKLTQAITIGETTYPVGTAVQVMVEQPKFYYKVVPIKLEKNANGKGFHMRKGRYYVSDTMKEGFKLHPAFICDGKENDKIYLSAYEACAFDTSGSTYILDDGAFASAEDKLSSIAAAKPISGNGHTFTRATGRTMAANRGTGWTQASIQSISATMLLFLVEYAYLNTQTKLGAGVTNKASGSGNESELTGATTNLGNASGSVTNENGYNVPSYRGEENWYGNIWKWIDGINIHNDNVSVYIADHSFADNTDATPYEDAGINFSRTEGYIKAFGYNEPFDWLMMTSEVGGDSSLPVGDYFYTDAQNNGWRVAGLGGGWDSSGYAGGFCWYLDSSSGSSSRYIGGRLLYVPNRAS